jgi:hypothetical protein
MKANMRKMQPPGYPPSTVKQPRYHLPIFEGFAQCISHSVPVGQMVGERGSESAEQGVASLREDFRQQHHLRQCQQFVFGRGLVRAADLIEYHM